MSVVNRNSRKMNQSMRFPWERTHKAEPLERKSDENKFDWCSFFFISAALCCFFPRFPPFQLVDSRSAVPPLRFYLFVLLLLAAPSRSRCWRTLPAAGAIFLFLFRLTFWCAQRIKWKEKGKSHSSSKSWGISMELINSSVPLILFFDICLKKSILWVNSPWIFYFKNTQQLFSQLHIRQLILN